MDFFVIVITRNILYFPIVVVVQQKVLQYIFNRNHFKGKVRKKTRNPVLTHTNSCRTGKFLGKEDFRAIGGGGAWQKQVAAVKP